MKKTLSLLIALLLCVSAFSGCNNVLPQNADSQTTNTECEHNWERIGNLNESTAQDKCNKCGETRQYTDPDSINPDCEHDWERISNYNESTARDRCTICGETRLSQTTDDTIQPGVTDVHDAFDIRISWANWLDGTIVDEGCLNFDQLAISSVHHIPLHKFSSSSELDAFKARFGEDNSFDYVYNGKSFNENTADYDDAFFEENDLFLVYVDANSGSFSFDVNNIFNDGKSFGIYVNQTNNPEDVTDDMAGWFITVAVPKSATENCTLFDAIMGFPPCIDSNDMVDAVILKDGFTFKESWIDSNNELTESKTFVVESQEALNEIFTEFKDVNLDKEMVIVYCYTTIYIREQKLEKVSFDNNVLSIEFDVVDGKPGTGDATAPQTRTCVICLDKVAATEVKVTYNGQ